MAVVMGLDCGGSSTRVRVCDAEGQILFEGRSGPANLASTPDSDLQNHLAEATIGAPRVDVACGCFAGLLTHRDAARAKQLLSPFTGEAELLAFPDYVASLWADPLSDLLVIAGTGSVVVSRQGSGFTKSGAGGPLLGDEGSGFDIVRRALSRTLLSSQKIELSAAFRQSLGDAFGSEEPNEVIAAIYRAPSPARRVASLLPTLILDAAQGCGYATDALAEAQDALARRTADHLIQHMPGRPVIRLTLAGGVWDADSSLMGTFADRVHAFAEQQGYTGRLICNRLDVPPIQGAVALAFAHVHEH